MYLPDAYKPIADIHDRVFVFPVGFVLIRIQLMRFPFGNIEVFTLGV